MSTTYKDDQTFPSVIPCTVREYFAAKAMQGILANSYLDYRVENQECEYLAQAAVNFADALIEELNKPITKY